MTARLVAGWVTTSESLVLYGHDFTDSFIHSFIRFFFFLFFLKKGKGGRGRGRRGGEGLGFIRLHAGFSAGGWGLVRVSGFAFGLVDVFTNLVSVSSRFPEKRKKEKKTVFASVFSFFLSFVFSLVYKADQLPLIKTRTLDKVPYILGIITQEYSKYQI